MWQTGSVVISPGSFCFNTVFVEHGTWLEKGAAI
jgi:hypothetical protein